MVAVSPDAGHLGVTGKDSVFLTGASGFVGGHVLRALEAEGYPVCALVRPGSRLRANGPGVTPLTGDILASGALVESMKGCRYLIHTAALYSFAPRRRSEVWRTNVRGTEALLEAARIAGVERVVMTSSSATVGPVRGQQPATEENWAADPRDRHTYHGSKVAQERVALAAQIPTILLLPTAPVGPGDWKPTPTGKMIVDFMRGRIIGSLPGGMNVVPVEDVGRAHVGALEKGRPNERYLLGGENLKLTELWKLLAGASKRPTPRLQIPYALAYTAGIVDELRCRAFKDARPAIPMEGVHMGRDDMFVTSRKAEEELGFVASSVAQAVEREVRWYQANGYA